MPKTEHRHSHSDSEEDSHHKRSEHRHRRHRDRDDRREDRKRDRSHSEESEEEHRGKHKSRHRHKSREREEKDERRKSSKSHKEEKEREEKHKEKRHKKDKEKGKEKEKERHSESEEETEQEMSDGEIERNNERLRKRAKGTDSPSSVVTLEDFYRFNAKFRIWLLESRGKYFEDLQTTKKCQKWFVKFADAYNRKKLSEKYYTDSIHSSSIDVGARTKYRWKFAEDVDEMQLASVRDLIDTDTQKNDWSAMPFEQRRKGDMNPAHRGPQLPGSVSALESDKPRKFSRRPYNQSQSRGGVGPENPNTIDVGGQKYGSGDRQRAWEKNRAEALEDLAPKPDPGSYEARQQKKQIANMYKPSRGEDVGMEMDDQAMFGGDDFQRRLAAEKARKRSRMEKANSAQQTWRDKERERMEAFKRDMGLQ